MGNVILLLLIVAAVSGLTTYLYRRYNRPDRRLLRDFKQLRKMILSGLKGPNKTNAERLLDDCGGHLERVLNAKKQQHMLADMAQTTSEITGRELGTKGQSAVAAFDQRVADNLGDFFATLSRISSIVGLQEDEALDSLRDFAEDLETQRAELVKLTLELRQDDDPLERKLAALADSESEEQPAQHDVVAEQD